MERHDETDGWIFSDEYHREADEHWTKSWRPGTASMLNQFGWYVGLYTIKEDLTESFDKSAARWPSPFWNQYVNEVPLS